MQGELIQIDTGSRKKEKERPKMFGTPLKSEIFTKRKDKASIRKAARSVLSLISVLLLLVCAVCYAGRTESKLPTASEVLTNLIYGGMLHPVKAEETAPAQQVSADPVSLDEPSDAEGEKSASAQLFASLYDYDWKAIPEGMLAILPYDLSSEHDGTLSLYNDTELSPDINAFAAKEGRESACSGEGAPLVLILHTHGTEGYSDPGVSWYSDTFNIPRTTDTTKNVVQIGKVLSDRLNAAGISTIHCEIMHDAESYLGAYERSGATIQRILGEYPSIRYVFDVHRDSVLLEDGTKTRPVTVANGKIAAQIMTVVGSNALGRWHPDWEVNLEFAAKLQARLNKDYLGFARRICLRGTTYNQEMAPYSLLFEVGSCGNTLEEAENAAEILADELISMIKNGW